MNRSYNHIKHLVDTNDDVQSNLNARRLPLWLIQRIQQYKRNANQLDGKQRYTGFGYYEYDMPKFATPSWAQWSLYRGSLNFQEHLEDLEHDQARHQGIDDHGYHQTYYIQVVPPDITIIKGTKWR